MTLREKINEYGCFDKSDILDAITELNYKLCFCDKMLSSHQYCEVCIEIKNIFGDFADNKSLSYVRGKEALNRLKKHNL